MACQVKRINWVWRALVGLAGVEGHGKARLVRQSELSGIFLWRLRWRTPLPSYSGGLGVLAGDTVRAAADIKLPMVAVSLLYRKGYFTQRLAEDGTQTEEAAGLAGGGLPS